MHIQAISHRNRSARPHIPLSQPVQFSGLGDRFLKWWEKRRPDITTSPEFTENQVAIIPENHMYFRTLIHVLEQAKTSIKIDCFYLGGAYGDAVINILKSKIKDGVKVYYRGDQINGIGNPAEVKQSKKRLRIAASVLSNFEYVEHRRRDFINVIGSNHNKSVIIDDSLAMISSKNPSSSDEANADITSVIVGPAARAIAKQFNHAWKEDFGEAPIFSEQVRKGFTLPESEKVIFQTQSCRALSTDAGKRDCLKAILDGIEGARRIIKIHAFALSSRDIINALKAAAKRGVQINLLLDPHHVRRFQIPNLVAFWEFQNVPNVFLKGYYHEAVQARRLEGTCKTKDYAQFLNHNKLIIFDDEKAIAGSTNFTNADLWAQDNTSIEYNDGKALEKLTEYFDRHWRDRSLTMPKLPLWKKALAFLTRWIFEF